MKAAIRDLLLQQPEVSNRDVARLLKLTRQAVHRHLMLMVRSNELEPLGAGRATRYRLVRRSVEPATFRFTIDGLEEHAVWRLLQRSTSAIGDLGSEAETAYQYAITEMANNAIEHSGGQELQVTLRQTEKELCFELNDDGVGVFAHLQQRLGLPSMLAALQELSKGKITTMPERHTGEGIFFVSKLADRFELDANGLAWMVDNERRDMAVGLGTRPAGTQVRFEARPEQVRSLRALFDEYTVDYAFARTRTVIKLFGVGVRFVSRSEAKRLLAGLERFQEVILDFSGVEALGQGFADEVFRVWAADHPRVQLTPVNMVEPVAFMVQRALQDTPL